MRMNSYDTNHIGDGLLQQIAHVATGVRLVETTSRAEIADYPAGRRAWTWELEDGANPHALRAAAYSMAEAADTVIAESERIARSTSEGETNA